MVNISCGANENEPSIDRYRESEHTAHDAHFVPLVRVFIEEILQSWFVVEPHGGDVANDLSLGYPLVADEARCRRPSAGS